MGVFGLLVTTTASSQAADGDGSRSLGLSLSSYQSRAQVIATVRALEREAGRAQRPGRAAVLLEQAYAVRKFIGPKRQALEDIQKIERIYAAGNKEGFVTDEDRARAADAFWRRRELMVSRSNGEPDTAALRQHAAAYLARYGEVGGIDRAIVARFVLAEYDWLRSCPRRGLLGLCVTWQQGVGSRAGTGVHDRYVQHITPRIDAALRAKLREQLTPLVLARLKQPRTISPEPRHSTINRIRGTLARPGTTGDKHVYISRALLEQAVKREVNRALPQARAEVLSRVSLSARRAATREQNNDLRPVKNADKPHSCTELMGHPRQHIRVHRRHRVPTTAALKRLDELHRFSRRVRERDLRELPSTRRQEVYEALDKLEIYLADAGFERLLRERVPGNLQFHYDDWKKDSGILKWEREYREQVMAADHSRKRLFQYLEHVSEKRSELLEKYGRIVAHKRELDAVLLAAARTAMISLAVATKLRGVSIPSRVDTKQHVRTYCDVFADKAEPAVKQAHEALTYCVDRATVYQRFTPAAEWCERWLASLDPKYPMLREFVGGPTE